MKTVISKFLLLLWQFSQDIWTIQSVASTKYQINATVFFYLHAQIIFFVSLIEISKQTHQTYLKWSFLRVFVVVVKLPKFLAGQGVKFKEMIRTFFVTAF